MNNREIKYYADITDDDCVLYKGSNLKSMADSSNSAHQLKFESIKNGRNENIIISPNDLDDNKTYKCYRYERISSSGICYEKIAILNN